MYSKQFIQITIHIVISPEHHASISSQCSNLQDSIAEEMSVNVFSTCNRSSPVHRMNTFRWQSKRFFKKKKENERENEEIVKKNIHRAKNYTVR